MTDEQKQEIREELKMIYKYDQFIDENPDVQERVERGIELGRVEGKAEGRVEGMQRLILAAIQDRFPELAGQAQSAISGGFQFWLFRLGR